MGTLLPLRSLLFVPGNRGDLVPKAIKAGADALVLDLEDSVPVSAKHAARQCVAAELAQRPGHLTFVRINHPGEAVLDEDLAVLAAHCAQAVMLPKVNDVQEVAAVDQRLKLLERDRKLEPDSIALLVVIESARGLRDVGEILQGAPRIRGVGLASAEEGDFILDIGARWTPGGEALAYARGKLVCEARAAGIEWLIDGAFMNLQDSQALEAESGLARNCGFNGKVAVHPRQVAVINEAFSPTAAELERAHKLLEAYREAERQGRGAIQLQGVMVDSANLRWAERIVGLAGRLGER